MHVSSVNPIFLFWFPVLAKSVKCRLKHDRFLMIQESHDHLQMKTDVLGQHKRKILFCHFLFFQKGPEPSYFFFNSKLWPIRWEEVFKKIIQKMWKWWFAGTKSVCDVTQKSEALPRACEPSVQGLFYHIKPGWVPELVFKIRRNEKLWRAQVASWWFWAGSLILLVLVLMIFSFSAVCLFSYLKHWCYLNK